MDMSDVDKSWDHSWTTEEMRKKRREWSLAGDIGLLKHLQQFSENLVSKANKTQAALDTLSTQLKETGILVDNVTNTSLALANTQFIESRVQEDDIETKESSEEKHENTKTQDSAPENLLASISESVKQGINIMDEKYKVMDVACSDSEEEEEEGEVVVSVIVGPNDPYQDRPLPYVIGSEKWMESNKIGLESSSSSESEQADEEREESESEKEDASAQVFNTRHVPQINIARLSSSSSDSDNYPNNASYMNNKADTMSRNNVNSASESVTPNTVSKTSNETPNFAEELAKRLGTVRQAQKPIVDEANESSINRYKDDLFTSEKDDDVFNNDNLFSDKKDLFNDQVSANLWKEKTIKPYKSNIIPASIDVPPPINIVATKPRSTIDDLFADADSEEDSDDIFSSKNTVKKRTKEPVVSDNANPTNAGNASKKFLDFVTLGAPGNVATSTPDSNVKANFPNLFSDDENDDGDLFGNPKKQPPEPADTPLPTNTEPSKKKLVGGVSVLGDVPASDIESKVASRIIQRRQETSDSSDSDMPGNSDKTKSNTESAERDVLNIAAINRSSQIASGENSAAVNENANSSSGISVYPPNNDTGGSGLWNFQPEVTSTRLNSEEIYRERINSDSLFSARTRHTANVNSANANSNNDQQQQQQQQQQQSQEQQNTSSALQDDVFENDDLFGPPPLPSKSDLKRAAKSKIPSLFDDSDSGDELFSTASSGSRSQKSTDFFSAGLLSNDKTKSLPKSGGAGLFDDNVNIFDSKNAPDTDIFGVATKSKSTNAAASDDLFDNRGRDPVTSKSGKNETRMESKRISLFDDDDDGDLFGAKPPKSKSDRNNFFEDEDDLFLTSSKASNKERPSIDKNEPKTDVTRNVSNVEAEKEAKDDSPDGGLFSKTRSHGLLFEDDDYDDLFGKKSTTSRGDDHSTSQPKESQRSIVEQAQGLPEETESSMESSSLSRDTKTTAESVTTITESNVNSSESELEKTSFNKAAREADDTTKKSSPPKTLSLRTSSSPTSEEQGQQAPRRTVSGKIKNLMGKMGDLKILSPLDAPPSWRKSEEKTDEDEDRTSPPSVSEGSARKDSSHSTVSTANNAEVAINFDDLAQVETLSTAASKSRVRIQAKRRPQSRHARKSALRQSGIDFDTVDNADNDNSQEESHASTFSSSKDSSAPAINVAERLTANDRAQRSTIVDPSSTEDKSELGSISKESSMSVNRNTLLSPSTDEEDLFDVPPDLPEDPQKEDTLFGRAPILSPIDGEQSDRTPESRLDTAIGKTDDADVNASNSNTDNRDKESGDLIRSDVGAKSDTASNIKKNDERVEIDDEQDEIKKEASEEPTDPLRDSKHDPLKDPSQLFAFVTKTPSPEKSRSLLFADPDDSLFSSGSVKKTSEPKKKKKKKEILDLFADDDDAGNDLFSASLKRPVKKPLRDTKIGLFGDDDDGGGARNDEDDGLFGSGALGKTRTDGQKSSFAGRRKNIFDDDDKNNDDDDDDSSLFVESSGQSQKSDTASFTEPRHDLADSRIKSSNLKDIFGDAPRNDDDDIDLFATKTVVPKKVAASSTKSLFTSDDDDDDDGHIFGKQQSSIDGSKVRATTVSNSRPTVKKAVTRDLKKTAEKIVEDPLSLLRDD